MKFIHKERGKCAQGGARMTMFIPSILPLWHVNQMARILISRPLPTTPLSHSLSPAIFPFSLSLIFSLFQALTFGNRMLRQSAVAPFSGAPKRGPPKKRGNYNCGRCGLPKKGHVCSSGDGPALPPRSDQRLRRALSFEEERTPASATPAAEEEVAETAVARKAVDEEEEEDVVEVGGGVLPLSCLSEVLSRLSLKELMGAAVVCRGWRECVKKVWRSAEELRLRVSPRSHIGFVGSVLHKCAGLARLTLRMER